MPSNTKEVSSVLNVVERLRVRMKNESDGFNGVDDLDQIFRNNQMQALIRMHEVIQPDGRTSVHNDSLDLIDQIHKLHVSHPSNDVLGSLSKMLETSPYLLSLLSCHDKVANKEYDEPRLTEIVDDNYDEVKSSEESMKVVRLVKSDEPLGATIATDDISGNIVVARILKGGAADRSGLIHVNDIIVEVNGVSAQGKKPEELIQLLAGFSGPLTFKLIPGEISAQPRAEEMFLRPRFTFLPKSDSLIPCKEAGLAFYPGDILRVVSKDDGSWWQATKICSSNFESSNQSIGRAGLIPSIKLQTRREKLKKQSNCKNTPSPSIKGSNLSLMSNDRKTAWSVIRASFRRKRNSPHPVTGPTPPNKSEGSKFEPPSFPPYEVVSQLLPRQSGINPQPSIYRPIILVGPQGVGRNELKDRLIDSNPTHYGVPVPHTSRGKQMSEVDGRDYHFVTREYMETGIRDNLFLEYGEYKGNLYGTSLSAVRSVIQNHQVCVLTPYPQALSVLRTKELKPFIIFIQPPPLDQMDLNIPGDLASNVRAKLTIDRNRSLPFSKEELADLVRRGDKMKEHYGRLFDAKIINENIDVAFEQLKEMSFFLENDPQWVPAEWLL
uniref:MAGUK p55 subfamily member 7 n=1 Tax=Ciona intestinalis TaxID=7719 RepID=F6T143_CIOIN|nr:MAGUK p55 subfamily member 7 isoform X1 [Ciona intestinalis]|eukprot:XP_009862133.1 MAGUK p55 subfamily member 7 isoform X1 [Ciona intestinalis]